MRRLPRIARLGPCAVAAALMLGSPSALAQSEMRSLVVPSEGGVFIPPRSAPRLAARPGGPAAGVPIPPSARGNPVVLPDTGVGLATPLLAFALPALAGALLGGSLAGSRTGASAPARTR